MTCVRTVFFGTAELACPALAALATAPAHAVLAVVTQPDRPRGRALQLQPSPVKRVAQARGLPVLQPASARAAPFLDQLRALAPELIVVAAYGQILPPALLELPRHGCLNIHASLLPRHRGAAPIQWAILEGDATTGVTIMKIDAGLDTGDLLATVTTPIHDHDDARTLHDRLATLGATLLLDTIPPYLDGRIIPRAQPVAGVSYARKITRDDGRLDWTLPAAHLARRVRAFVPWPGTFTHLPGAPRPLLLKVWQATPLPVTGVSPGVVGSDPNGLVVGCGTGALRLDRVQLEGGRPLAAAAFLAGHPLPPGLRLG